MDSAFQKGGAVALGRLGHQAAGVGDLLAFLVPADLVVQGRSLAAEVDIGLVVVVVPVAGLVLAGIRGAAAAHVPGDGVVRQRGAGHRLVQAAVEHAQRHALVVPVEGELVGVGMVDHEIAADEGEVGFLRCGKRPSAQEGAEAGIDLRTHRQWPDRHGGIDDQQVRHAHAGGEVAAAFLPQLHELAGQFRITGAEQRAENAGERRAASTGIALVEQHADAPTRVDRRHELHVVAGKRLQPGIGANVLELAAVGHDDPGIEAGRGGADVVRAAHRHAIGAVLGFQQHVEVTPGILEPGGHHRVVAQGRGHHHQAAPAADWHVHRAPAVVDLLVAPGILAGQAVGEDGQLLLQRGFIFRRAELAARQIVETVGDNHAMPVAEHPAGVADGVVHAGGKIAREHLVGLLHDQRVVFVKTRLVLVTQKGVEHIAWRADSLAFEPRIVGGLLFRLDEQARVLAFAVPFGDPVPRDVQPHVALDAFGVKRGG